MNPTYKRINTDFVYKQEPEDTNEMKETRRRNHQNWMDTGGATDQWSTQEDMESHLGSSDESRESRGEDPIDDQPE